jgi:hypothetical protein
MSFSEAEMVRKYVELRDRKKQIEESIKGQVELVVHAMTTLENALLERMNVSGAESIKTEFGTAYKSKVMATKVADRGSLMQYVQEQNAFHLLTAAVSKEAVRDYMETSGGFPPPGVDVTFITTVNFRRPS